MTKKKVTIVAYYCTYASASILARSLYNCVPSWEVSLVYAKPDRYGFHEVFPGVCWKDDPGWCVRNVQSADLLIFCGTPSLWKFFRLFITKHSDWKWKSDPASSYRWLSNRATAIIITDSWFYEDPPLRNKEILAAGCQVMIMPDLVPYLDRHHAETWVPYYHPIKVPYVVKPQQPIILAHSPGHANRLGRKGTKIIVDAFSEMERRHGSHVCIDIIMGETRSRCLHRKSRAHIFVDQIVNLSSSRGFQQYLGGIGKSGCEAMMLGCTTVTSGRQSDLVWRNYAKSFPPPPVFLADEECLVGVLNLMVRHQLEGTGTTRAQEDWAKEYLSPRFVANHVYRSIQC